MALVCSYPLVSRQPVAARACDWGVVVICCLGVLLAAAGCGGSSTHATVIHRGPSAYALFLGDSFATGFHATAVPPAGDTTCMRRASMTTGSGGWVCIFVHSLRARQPRLRFKNAAVEGETTCSFFGTYCPYLPPAQQKSLVPHPDSQMATALAYLRQHRGQVGPITFELGADDQIEPGVRGQDMSAMEARVDSILARLRHAAPRADLIVMSYPHSPVPSPAFDRREASKYAALFVDVHTHFAHHPKYVDYTEHPTDVGQRTVARLLWQTYKRWIEEK